MSHPRPFSPIKTFPFSFSFGEGGQRPDEAWRGEKPPMEDDSLRSGRIFFYFLQNTIFYPNLLLLANGQYLKANSLLLSFSLPVNDRCSSEAVPLSNLLERG
jgi:hypothetical protein